MVGGDGAIGDVRVVDDPVADLLSGHGPVADLVRIHGSGGELVRDDRAVGQVVGDNGLVGQLVGGDGVIGDVVWLMTRSPIFSPVTALGAISDSVMASSAMCAVSTTLSPIVPATLNFT